MCNLGEGIRERALAEGMTRGIEAGMTRGITEGRLTERMQAIQNMIKLGIEDSRILEMYTEEELNKAKSA